MKTTTLTFLAAGVLLAGCSGGAEPAPPPTSEDALTTSDPTTDAAPTTQAPRDDVAETSSAPDDVSETTEAGGPPELPEEATEDSEAGAAAFAEHYIDMINYTSKHPQEGLLPELSSDDCELCASHEETVVYSVKHQETAEGDILGVNDVVSLYSVVDSEANVRVAIYQIEQDFVDNDGEVVDHVDEQEATMVFALSWDGRWIADAIRVEPVQP